MADLQIMADPQASQQASQQATMTSSFDSKPKTLLASSTRNGSSAVMVLLWLVLLGLAFLVGMQLRKSSTTSAETTARAPLEGTVVKTEAGGPGQEATLAFSQQVPARRPSGAQPVDTGLSDHEQRTIRVFRDASPSVVFVTTIVRTQDRFRRRVLEVPTGTGSGFVWDDQGHVVTNYHVLLNRRTGRLSEARVTFPDGQQFAAVPVGGAPEKDLAVLRVDAPKKVLRSFPSLAVGTSSNLIVGQSVLAIGNPFGLDLTLTTGVVSALGREITSLAEVPIEDVIQTDAAINPGNSGGPLLDSSGRLIGVNTQIYSPSGASAGIGFAIPVDTVSWVVRDILRYGRIQRPTIGITMWPAQSTQRLGLRGALVRAVYQGTGAEDAGLRGTYETRQGGVQLGDLIVAVGDRTVEDSGDVVLALEHYEPGDEVDLKVVRDPRGEAEELTVKVRLERTQQTLVHASRAKDGPGCVRWQPLVTLRSAFAASSSGGVAEWSNAPVLKTGVGSRRPWVRIPTPSARAAEGRLGEGGGILCGSRSPWGTERSANPMLPALPRREE